MSSSLTPVSRKHIVLITHGFLSQGAFFNDIRRALKEKGCEAKGLRYPTVYLLQLWMPPFIGRWILPWFSRESALQQLLHEILAYPQDEYEISIVAHSFGTWIVSEILRRYPAVKVKRVAFVGSIVKDTFPWNEIVGRNVGRNCLLNNVGTKDIWPLCANIITWGYGPTGTFGFEKAHIEDRYHNVGHSGLLTFEFARDYLAPFLVQGEFVDPTDERREFWRTKILDFFKNFKYVTLVCLVLWLGWYLTSKIGAMIPRPASSAPAKLVPNWKSWDVANGNLRINDAHPTKVQARLDKWRNYLSQGAQPWLKQTTADGMPVASSLACGWCELEIADYDLNTLSYVFEYGDRNLIVKEIYVFLTHNNDQVGYEPVYRQMIPTIDKEIQEIQLVQYQANERLLCFIIVGTKDGKPIAADPSQWSIQLRRK